MKYTVTVEKYNGFSFTETYTKLGGELEFLANQCELGEKIVVKRVSFENMEPETHYYYEKGRIRTRINHTIKSHGRL